jgi:hypothetical protein
MKLLNGADFNAKRATNVSDASADTDFPSWGQVKTLLYGQNFKSAVRVATTTNGTLATAFANGQTVNGVVLATGDRILIKNQSTGSENGIYTVNASGAPTRATDADSSSELDGAVVYARGGTTDPDTVWKQTADAPTVGSTSLVWVQTGTGYSAGNGLSLTGATFAVVPGTGILADGTSTRIDTSVVARKYAADCVATTNPQTFNHALASSNVIVQVRDKSSGAFVLCDYTVTDANNISVDFGGAPTSAQYTVTVLA